MAEIKYFIRDEYMGSSPIYTKWVHNKQETPFGRAFFCKKCAVVWAIAYIEGEETYADYVLCEKHESTSSFSTPGCLWLSWDDDWNKALPKEVLARDFLLLCNHKGITGN